MTRPESVADYLTTVPASQRPLLESIRAAVRAAAPDADEALYYGMPAIRAGRRWLVAYAAFRAHCSLFPLGAALLDAMEAELGPWRTSKGTLRITADRPMPDALIARLVAERITQATAADAATAAKAAARRRTVARPPASPASGGEA